MPEPFATTCAALDAGTRYQVRCPDGETRVLWGYNGPTGDVYIAGWDGEAWMECTDGTLRIAFA